MAPVHTNRTAQRIITVAIVAFIMLMTAYGALTILKTAAQRSVPVEALTRAVNKYISTIDATPRGIRYRWVPSAVTVAVPSPFAQGIVEFESWFWPASRDTQMTIDGVVIPIPSAQAEGPRRYRVLTHNTTWKSETAVTLTATGTKPFWAFTGMQTVPVTAIPHPSLVLLACAVVGVLSVVVWRWLPSIVWATIISHSVLVLWMIQTTPVASYLPQTLARSDRWQLLAGVCATMFILLTAPLPNRGVSWPFRPND